MAPLRVAGVLSCAVGAFSLEIQKPRVSLLEASVTEHTDTEQDTALQAKLDRMETELEAAERRQAESPELHPSLAPKSDKKFFGKDYPSDMRPSIDKAPKWSYPYPKVQADKKYDVDYVEDENADGGHWSAQMDYDTIKMKYAKQQGVLNEALAKEELERQQAEAAAAAREKEAAASGAADVGKATHKSNKTLQAEEKVKHAALHLKDCQKALDDAKAALRASQKADYEKEHGASMPADAGSAEEPQSALAVAAEREEAEHVLAQKVVAEEKNKLQHLESALKAAEAKLRKFRGEPDAGDAKLHAEQKSDAPRLSAGVVVVALSALLTCA